MVKCDNNVIHIAANNANICNGVTRNGCSKMAKKVQHYGRPLSVEHDTYDSFNFLSR
jgi:hypothetical protein